MKVKDLTKPLVSYDTMIQSLINFREELAEFPEDYEVRKVIIWKLNSCLFSKYPLDYGESE